MKSLIFIIFITLFCSNNAFALEIDDQLALKQNQTYNFATSEWAERIKVSGLIMGEVILSDHDAGSSRRFSTAPKKNYSTFCFPRASLYIDAQVNTLTQAHLALNFAPDKISNVCSACGFGKKNDELRFGKYNKIDESYVTFGNLAESQYYARIGIQYVPYGYYTRNTIPATLPQLMTQTQAAGATTGYSNDNGMNLAIFIFSGKNKTGGSTKIDNVGTQIGYIKSTEESNSLVTLGWMNNIANSVNYLVSSSSTCCGKESNPLSNGYRKRVQGMSLTLHHQELNWDTTLQLTSALSKFNPGDIAWKGKGAKPSAGLIDLGYRFEAFGKRKNRIGTSYQLSNQAINIKGNSYGAGLPKQRIQGDYTIEINPNVELGTHIFWDKDYPKNDSGTSKKGTTVLLTMSVKLG